MSPPLFKRMTQLERLAMLAWMAEEAFYAERGRCFPIAWADAAISDKREKIESVRALLISLRYNPSPEMEKAMMEAFIVARAPFAAESRRIANDENRSDEERAWNHAAASAYTMGNLGELRAVWQAAIDSILEGQEALQASLDVERD